MTTYESLDTAFDHLIGDPNEISRDEQTMYLDVLNSMLTHPGSQYYFYFNQPITAFGVPSKSLRIRDHHEEYLGFVMKRCRVGRKEALELMALVGHEPIRTNTLLLDVGKVYQGKLVMALELNRAQHYRVPEDNDSRQKFARAIFGDMLKEKELRKISEILEVNYCRRQEGSATTAENLQIDRILYDFVHIV